MEWISVKDRLPEEDGDYLVYKHSEEIYFHFPDVHIVEYVVEIGFTFDGYTRYEVTHWMPLPEPPKGE